MRAILDLTELLGADGGKRLQITLYVRGVKAAKILCTFLASLLQFTLGK